jgi:hypothetical protein
MAMAEPNITETRLLVTRSNDGLSWNVENQTGAQLAPLIVNTDDGWLVAETLNDGQTASLNAVDASSLESLLAKMIATPSSRLGQLERLKQKMLSYERELIARPNYNSWNGRPVTTAWDAYNELFVPGIMTNPQTIRGTIPIGGWLGLTRDWNLAGDLPNGARYSHEFHLIHGRWN